VNKILFYQEVPNSPFGFNDNIMGIGVEVVTSEFGSEGVGALPTFPTNYEIRLE